VPILDGKEQELQGVLETARLMVVAARTAPKSGGVDDIFTAVVVGEEIGLLADDMEKMGAERNVKQWTEQAPGVRNSDAIVLIGARGTKRYVTNCGACGYASCTEFEKAEKKRGQDFEGPTCLFKALDLGVAVCSAAKVASILNVDNRIYYRIGAAAKRLHYMPEASVIMGLALSATGKNPYFDRKI
jgi:uncharacterized ferredoxin-like protein